MEQADIRDIIMQKAWEKVPEIDIASDEPFEEIGMDSVDTVGFLVAVEKALGIRFSDEDVARMRTIDDVVSVTERMTKA